MMPLTLPLFLTELVFPLESYPTMICTYNIHLDVRLCYICPNQSQGGVSLSLMVFVSPGRMLLSACQPEASDSEASDSEASVLDLNSLLTLPHKLFLFLFVFAGFVGLISVTYGPCLTTLV